MLFHGRLGLVGLVVLSHFQNAQNMLITYPSKFSTLHGKDECQGRFRPRLIQTGAKYTRALWPANEQHKQLMQSIQNMYSLPLYVRSNMSVVSPRKSADLLGLRF